jgi:opacity protein-like surface antigen
VQRKDSIVTRQPRPALLLTCLLGLVLTAGSANAGDGQGTDLFAGYSFAQIQDTHRHGANLAAGFDLVGPLSGFVDTSVHWGSQEGVNLSDMTLMAGPGVRFGTRGATVFFARALAGLVRDKASIEALDVDISETSSSFGVLAGGGVDFRVASQLAVRLQGDYLWNHVDEGESSGYRVSAGVVYRFGSAR